MMTAKERNTLILECQLNDLRPAVTWTRNNEPIEVRNRFFSANECQVQLIAHLIGQSVANLGMLTSFRSVTLEAIGWYNLKLIISSTTGRPIR